MQTQGRRVGVNFVRPGERPALEEDAVRRKPRVAARRKDAFDQGPQFLASPPQGLPRHTQPPPPPEATSRGRGLPRGLALQVDRGERSAKKQARLDVAEVGGVRQLL